jgi:hypothetical protein
MKLCINLVFCTIDISVGVSDTVFQLKRKLYIKNVENRMRRTTFGSTLKKETGGKKSIMSSFVTFITD